MKYVIWSIAISNLMKWIHIIGIQSLKRYRNRSSFIEMAKMGKYLPHNQQISRIIVLHIWFVRVCAFFVFVQFRIDIQSLINNCKLCSSFWSYEFAKHCKFFVVRTFCCLKYADFTTLHHKMTDRTCKRKQNEGSDTSFSGWNLLIRSLIGYERTF